MNGNPAWNKGLKKINGVFVRSERTNRNKKCEYCKQNAKFWSLKKGYTCEEHR